MKAKVLGFATVLLYSSTSLAMSWSDFWKRDDQQGANLLKHEQPAAAAKKFTDPLWQGVAWYRAGDYVAAAQAFQQQRSDLSYYNLGNALAQTTQYQDAILAYEQALKLNPHHVNAAYNKKLLEDYLKKNPPAPQQQQMNSHDNKQNHSHDNKAASNQEQQQTAESSQQKSPNSASTGNAAERAGKASSLMQPAASARQQTQQQPDSSDAHSAAQKLSPQTAVQGFSTKGQGGSPDAEADNVLEAVQDDPGGLLRQKFLRDYLRKQQEVKR